MAGHPAPGAATSTRRRVDLIGTVRGFDSVATIFTLAELDQASALVHAHVPPTPQFEWPLLTAEVGARLVVKHENHTPVGAFKVRGGLVAVDRLCREQPSLAGLISATRGNHGQSVAFAGRVHSVPVVIVVPRGNSAEKNAAMEALGAELIVYGDDFQDAREHAQALSAARGLHMVDSFHRDLVLGVATYAGELFGARPDLDVVYVPIGLGSGICGVITVRDLLGLHTEIVGVVAEGAPTYQLSVAAGHPVPTERADTFVDGVACRIPHPLAIEIIAGGAARIVAVPDDATAEAVRMLHRTTHNTAEPAGAIALAGALAERDRIGGRTVGVVLTGGNVDSPFHAAILSGAVPGTVSSGRRW